MRALLGEHRMLLLESPFDHMQEPFRRNTISYINKNKKVTVLIASEDEELGNYCDQVLLLSKDGETDHKQNLNG